MRGEVTLHLDKVRTLKYDLNASAEFEDATGQSITEAFQSFDDGTGKPKLSIKTIRALLWAGLLHEDENLTLRKAGELFDSYVQGDGLVEKLTFVFPTISEAFLEGFGDENAKKKFREAREAMLASTGEKSSESATARLD
jgi:hypothetical protein